MRRLVPVAPTFAIIGGAHRATHPAFPSKLARRNLIGTRGDGNDAGMGIGVGTFLIVVGAILTFALNTTIAGTNLDVVGWILMLAGAAGLILFFYYWNRRRAPRPS
jgi:hypothetical protein